MKRFFSKLQFETMYLGGALLLVLTITIVPCRREDCSHQQVISEAPPRNLRQYLHWLVTASARTMQLYHFVIDAENQKCRCPMADEVGLFFLPGNLQGE